MSGSDSISYDGKVTLVWGDGENVFQYKIAQFRELQEKVNSRRVRIGAPMIGPFALLNLLREKDAWPDDVRDILYIGLVGAGMTPKEAHNKLVLYFDTRPILEHTLTAFTVLVSGLVQPAEETSDEDVKKKTEEKTLEMDLSIFGPSSETALQ